MNRDITTYHFTCMHSCSEWKWNQCPHCRSKRKCKDHIRPVYLTEEGISYPTEEIEVSFFHSQDLGTYVHEFTEDTVIALLKSLHKDWYAAVKYKGYGETYIAHFICLWGTNNNKCLDPCTKRNKPRW